MNNILEDFLLDNELNEKIIYDKYSNSYMMKDLILFI